MSAAPTPGTRARPSRRSRRARAGRGLRLALAGLSLGGSGFLSAAYLVRPLGWDPLTSWPSWMWLGGCLAAGLISISRRAPRRNALVLGVALLSLALVPEEPLSLLRSLAPGPEARWQQARHEGRALRVVTLNCAGEPRAMQEAWSQDPDVVLLQEHPGAAALADLMPSLPGWGLAAELDAAVLVRGAVEQTPVGIFERGFMCAARVWPERWRGPAPLAVVSVHLTHPLLRAAFWRRGDWREARAIQERRQETLAAAARYACGVGPALAGGDFNAPGGDALFAPWHGCLRDSFRKAGVGWPDTITNWTPISRIDQVWSSPELAPLRVQAVPTRWSDHRLVVCDLTLGR